MEGWKHVTTMREVIREEDSPVRRSSTRVEETREEIKDQKQIANDQPPHVEEQSGNKDDILWR